MPVTVIINDLTLVHKSSMGTAVATIPDVCKTPSPGGPVPMPYPNIALSADLMKGTTTVKADGGNMCANKGSELFKSTGDEPGVGGGVKSSTFIKEATWLLYSFDVMLEGKNACRLTDKLFINHENTVCMAGWLQQFLAANKRASMADACKALGEYIDDMIGEGRTGDRGKSFPGRGLEERMNQNMGMGLKKGNPGFPPGSPGWATHDNEIQKLQDDLGKKTDEYEKECASHAGRQAKPRIKNARAWQRKPRPTAADWSPG